MTSSRHEIRDYFGQLHQLEPLEVNGSKYGLTMLFMGMKVKHIFDLDIESAKTARQLFKLIPDFDYKQEIEKNHNESISLLDDYNPEVAKFMGTGVTWQSCLKYAESADGQNLQTIYNKYCQRKLQPTIMNAKDIMESGTPHQESAMLVIGAAIHNLLMACSNHFEQFGAKLYVKSINKQIQGITKRNWQNCHQFSQGKKGKELAAEILSYTYEETHNQ